MKNVAEEFVGSVLNLRPKIGRQVCFVLFLNRVLFTFVLSLQGYGKGKRYHA